MTQYTPTVEELARKFCNSFASKLVPSNEAMIATRLLHGLVPELLTTYGNARYEEGVKAERERCKRCYEANTRHNPHSLSEPYSPNYKNANTATTHISYLDYIDFVPKHVSPPTSHSYTPLVDNK